MKNINNKPVGCRLNKNYVYWRTVLIYVILISIYFIFIYKYQKRRTCLKLDSYIRTENKWVCFFLVETIYVNFHTGISKQN